jgi:transposase
LAVGRSTVSKHAGTKRHWHQAVEDRRELLAERLRLLRYLLILGRPVYLRIRPKRFRCPFCDDHPTTTQTLDWYDPNALHTIAYERHLIVQLINSTLTDVTEKEDVSYDALLGILDRTIAKTVDWAATQHIFQGGAIICLRSEARYSTTAEYYP